MNPQQFEAWRDKLEPVLILKADEFQMLGQTNATKDAVWETGVAKLQKEKEFIPFYEFVNKFMRLSVTDYMNRLTIQAYRGVEGWSKDTDDELEGVLNDVLRH